MILQIRAMSAIFVSRQKISPCTTKELIMICSRIQETQAGGGGAGQNSVCERRYDESRVGSKNNNLIEKMVSGCGYL